jgi:hypothetical protein
MPHNSSLTQTLAFVSLVAYIATHRRVQGRKWADSGVPHLHLVSVGTALVTATKYVANLAAGYSGDISRSRRKVAFYSPGSHPLKN